MFCKQLQIDRVDGSEAFELLGHPSWFEGDITHLWLLPVSFYSTGTAPWAKGKINLRRDAWQVEWAARY